MTEKVKGLAIRGGIVGIIAVFTLMGIGMSGEAFWSENALYMAYTLFGVALACATVLSLVMTILSDPKSLVKPLIAVVALAILFGIGYAMAEGQELTLKTGNDTKIITADIPQKVGAALNMLYILGGLAIVAVVVGEVSKIFK